MASLTRHLLLLISMMLVACTAAGSGTVVDRDGAVIQRELLPDRQNLSKRVEVFWTKPAGPGPWPVVLFIHGHQEQIRNGGEMYVTSGRLGTMARRGYVAAALSQPGYGNSDGQADFCGRRTQEAALGAMAFLRDKPFVNPDKVVLYGYSRGAIVAAMVASRDPRLAGVILGAGAYDFFTWYPTPLRGIDAYIVQEAGTSPEAFRARSAIYHVATIKAPILLLHGAQDERIPVRQAEAFHEKLRAAGRSVTLKISPAARHGIPIDEQHREVYPFLFLEAAVR
jgi:dipeptidyl aminopeptidase/acylaminoacyl peptidase